VNRGLPTRWKHFYGGGFLTHPGWEGRAEPRPTSQETCHRLPLSKEAVQPDAGASVRAAARPALQLGGAVASSPKRLLKQVAALTGAAQLVLGDPNDEAFCFPGVSWPRRFINAGPRARRDSAQSPPGQFHCIKSSTGIGRSGGCSTSPCRPRHPVRLGRHSGPSRSADQPKRTVQTGTTSSGFRHSRQVDRSRRYLPVDRCSTSPGSIRESRRDWWLRWDGRLLY
jgi:hypothetical protein